MALALTFVAGFIDAVGYLAVYRLFTAHMSGNSVHLGIYIAGMHVGDIARAGVAIFSFIVGLLYSRILIEVGARSRFRRIASWTFGTEVVAILSGIAVGSAQLKVHGHVVQYTWAFYVVIALLTFAMGVQSGTLTRIGALTVYTTFVTGTLTRFAGSISRWLFWAADQWSGGKRVRQIFTETWHQKSFREAAYLLTLWALYMCGGVSGALAEKTWSLHALYLPAVFVAAAVLLDQRRPMAIEEEEQQLK